MGSYFSDVQLYMQADDPSYQAGDYVNGCIYINAKKSGKYNRLVIHLIGKEYVSAGTFQGI